MGGIVLKRDSIKYSYLKKTHRMVKRGLIKTREVIKKVRKPLPGPTRVHKGKKAYNRKMAKRIIQEAYEDIRQGQDKGKG